METKKGGNLSSFSQIVKRELGQACRIYSKHLKKTRDKRWGIVQVDTD